MGKHNSSSKNYVHLTRPHEISPHAHYKHLHSCMNIHTKIRLHTKLHKILPYAHHKPLHTHTTIHTALFTRCPFICKMFFFVTPFINICQGYITFSTNMSSWISTLSAAWRNWNPEHPTIKALGRAIIFLKRTDTTFLEEGFPRENTCN